RHKNYSFRRAHAVVGRFIRLAILNNLTTNTVNGALLNKAAFDLGLPLPNCCDKEIRDAFDAELYPRLCVSTGSVSPSEVKILHKDAVDALEISQSWQTATESYLRKANEKLQHTIETIVNPA